LISETISDGQWQKKKNGDDTTKRRRALDKKLEKVVAKTEGLYVRRQMTKKKRV